MTQQEIQSYLVKLAYAIDKQSEASFLKSIGGGSGALAKLSSVAAAAAGALAIVSSALTAATVQIVSFTVSAANANKENERFARMMFTSERAAYSFNTALQAMGKSMDDIAYMTPEEYRQFNELRNLSNSIGLPADYNQTMRGVRNTIFEVTRLKAIVSQAMAHIAYYIAKYLELPMERFRKKIRDFADWLQKNIPKIADVVGKLSLGVIRLVEGVSWLVEQGLQAASVIGEKLPTSFLAAAAGLAAFFTLMAAGPIGWFIAGIAALLLLLDDIATWQRGGISALGGVYEAFTRGFSQKFDFSAFDELGKSWEFIVKKVNEFLDVLFQVDEEGTGIKSLFEHMGKMTANALSSDLVILKDIFIVAGNLMHIVTSIMRALTGTFSWDDFINGFDFSGMDAPPFIKDLIGLTDFNEDYDKAINEHANRILESEGYIPVAMQEALDKQDGDTNINVLYHVDEKGAPYNVTGTINGFPISPNVISNIYAAGGYAP